jgi:hypothetical protein
MIVYVEFRYIDLEIHGSAAIYKIKLYFVEDVLYTSAKKVLK